MYWKCCIPHCESRRTKKNRLHKFPSDKRQRNKWLDCIDIDKLNSLDSASLVKLAVCQKHFEKRFITTKSGVKVTAYPTLFSSQEIEDGIPTKSYDDVSVNPIGDHGYSKKKMHLDHTYANPEGSKETRDQKDQPSDNTAPQEENESRLPEEYDTYTDFDEEVLGCSEAAEETDKNPVSSYEVVIFDSNIDEQISSTNEKERNSSNNEDAVPLPKTGETKSSRKDSKENVPLKRPKSPLKSNNSPRYFNLPTIKPKPAEPVCSNISNTRIETIDNLIRTIVDNSPEAGQNLCFNCSIPVDTRNSNLIAKIRDIGSSKPKFDYQAKYRSLYKKFAFQRTRLNKLKLKLRKQQMFDSMTENLNPIAKQFFRTQINLRKTKHANGLRFSAEEKILALSVLKLSRPCYRLLKKIFILPSLTTLKKLYKSITGLELYRTEQTKTDDVSQPEARPNVEEELNAVDRNYMVEYEINEQNVSDLNPDVHTLVNNEEGDNQPIDSQSTPTEVPNNENQGLTEAEILETPLGSLLNSIINPKPKPKSEKRRRPKTRKRDETAEAVASISSSVPKQRKSKVLKNADETIGPINPSPRKRRKLPKRAMEPLIPYSENQNMNSSTYIFPINQDPGIPSEGSVSRTTGYWTTRAPLTLENVNNRSAVDEAVEESPSPRHIYRYPKEYSSEELVFSTRNTDRVIYYSMPQL